MNRKFHPALRVIASFLLVSFFLRDVAFAAIDFKPSQFELFQKPLVNFEIPRSIALVEDAWQADSIRHQSIGGLQPQSSKTVFILQDAHTNESGQFNSAKALKSVLSHQKIK